MCRMPLVALSIFAVLSSCTHKCRGRALPLAMLVCCLQQALIQPSACWQQNVGHGMTENRAKATRSVHLRQF